MKVDAHFDKKFLDLLCRRDPAMFDTTDAEIGAAGNGTHEIRNWIAVAGAVEGARGEVVMHEERTMVVGCSMMQFQP